MRRWWILLAVLVAFDAGVWAWTAGREPAAAPGAVRVGLVFDVGGRGDKSFNDQAYVGLVRARDELGARVEYVEPGEGSDRESALRMFASRGFDLVVGTGFIFTDDVNAVALEYPGVRFTCVDYALKIGEDGRPVPPPSNVAALKFREEEGSFLAGALAALVSRTGVVGFVGGMDIPLIRRFEAGYRAGVVEACPSCRVIVNYAGVTGSAFKDPGKGKELALAQYRGGADVVYHASGSTGLGVFEAARQEGKLAIGVDSDQYHEAPGFVLSSMVKRVDEVLFRTVRDVRDGTFQAGVRSFGLAEDGVSVVDDEHNAALIPDVVRARLRSLRDRIVDGSLPVPGS